MSRSLTTKILLGVLISLLTVYGWQIRGPYRYQLNSLEQESAQQMQEMVGYFATYLGPRDHINYTSLNSAADYIADKFANMGYTVIEQNYEADGKKYRNIIARVTAEERYGEELVLVGAHYDTWEGPGADDNASGVVVMLELARLVRRDPAAVNIKFVAFTNEEPPFYKTKDMGSRVYVEKAWDKGERLKLAIILEMVGYYNDNWFGQRYPLFLGPFFPNRGNYVAMVCNYASKKSAKGFYKHFRKLSDFPVAFASLTGAFAGVDWSDQVSFWQKDYPAVMLTDTAFYRNPHYHRNTDNADTLDYPRMAKLVFGLQKAVLALAAE